MISIWVLCKRKRATFSILADAEFAFTRLECEAQIVLKDLLDRTFVFLRFRNSAGYRATVQSLEESYLGHPSEGVIYSAYRPLIVQLRLQYILRGFI